MNFNGAKDSSKMLGRTKDFLILLRPVHKFYETFNIFIIYTEIYTRKVKIAMTPTSHRDYREKEFIGKIVAPPTDPRSCLSLGREGRSYIQLDGMYLRVTER